MGTSTNAMLIYGYDLGSEEKWLLEGAGEWGEFPKVDWYDSESEDGEDEGFYEAVEDRLLRVIGGFTETDWQAEGYFDRKREARKKLGGVEIETHCSGDYPMYVLSAKRITAYRGDVETIDFIALEAEVQESDADAKLQAALDALGVRPLQAQPKWLLCSYWG